MNVAECCRWVLHHSPIHVLRCVAWCPIASSHSRASKYSGVQVAACVEALFGLLAYVVNCGYPMWHMIDDFFLQLVLVVWVMVSTGTASRRSRISSQNRVMAAEYVTICHVCHIKTRCHVKLQDVARCCKKPRKCIAFFQSVVLGRRGRLGLRYQDVRATFCSKALQV